MIAAYPITPQTHIVEALAEYVAKLRKLDAEYITVENEFSALVRMYRGKRCRFTHILCDDITGLRPLCLKLLYVAGMRLPIVMSIANRALGAPLSIWNDQ